MFNVVEKAYKLAGERPHLLGKIGYSLAFGGQCEKKDVFQIRKISNCKKE